MGGSPLAWKETPGVSQCGGNEGKEGGATQKKAKPLTRRAARGGAAIGQEIVAPPRNHIFSGGDETSESGKGPGGVPEEGGGEWVEEVGEGFGGGDVVEAESVEDGDADGLVLRRAQDAAQKGLLQLHRCNPHPIIRSPRPIPSHWLIDMSCGGRGWGVGAFTCP